MNRFFLRILLALVAVSGHVICHVHSAEGSWFDGMEFEDYHPPGQQDGDENKPPQDTTWRIPCGIIREGTDDSSSNNVMPLSTIVDLDLSTSTIHESFLLSQFTKDDLSKLMVHDKSNNTYTIPSGSLWLRMGSIEATVLTPTLQVITEDVIENGNGALQDGSIQLRLGTDFISMYQGRLDVEGAGGLLIVVNQDDGKNEKEEVLIPIWKPRSPINSHEEL